MVVRLVVPPQETVLLLGLPAIPVAQGLAMSPWIVIITILAVVMMWFLPTQTNPYLVAYAATDGRLFSHAQARRVAFGYAAVVLCGLALMVPDWHALGLV
jgi:predicted ABC-type sugar transport system permease subunit